MIARMEWIARFLRYLLHRFIDDKLSNIAAMLTLTSLLAVIPLMAVVFSMLSALPLAQSLGEGIQTFIFSNFVPTFGQEIELTMRGFVQKASEMKTIGFSSLVVTAILLLRTIDTAFNQIWRTEQQRKGLIAFLFYWLVLVLGPLLLGISIALSSYFTSLLIMTDTGRQIGSLVTVFLPWLMTTMGLAILYLVIPNSRIKLIHAVTGALVAGILFEIAKVLFTMYVTSFPLQEIIFGALSAVPLFLIWVYISWLVVLLGAEVCHGMENFRADRDDSHQQSNHFLDCLRVLMIIEQQRQKHKVLDRVDIIEILGDISDSSIADCLHELIRIGLIEEIKDGRYKLIEDLNSYTLYQFSQAVYWKLPTAEMIKQSEFSTTYLGKELMNQLQHLAQQPTCSLIQSYRQV